MIIERPRIIFGVSDIVLGSVVQSDELICICTRVGVVLRSKKRTVEDKDVVRGAGNESECRASANYSYCT